MEFDMVQIRLRGFAKTLVYGETQVSCQFIFLKIFTQLEKELINTIQIGGSVSTLIQSVGMGGLRPNTLLLSWPIHTHGASREAIDSEYQTFTGSILRVQFLDVTI